MRVLVTGAAGFVGRPAVARLLAEGHEVRATVRTLSESADPRVDWRVTGDLTGAVDWAAVLQGVDAVVHLAALAHQVGRKGLGRMEEFLRVNEGVTADLARAARQSSVRRFVLLSSVASVGGRGLEPVNEETPEHPEGDYGRSKLAAERAIAGILAGSPVSWIALRAPLVYGAENPGNMARLLALLERGWPLPFAGLRNSRSFLYVENLVDAIVTALCGGAAAEGVFFVDDGTRFSTPGLCAALATARGLPLRLFRLPPTALRALGRLGDLGEWMLRRDLPINTYSVERLSGSLVVDGRRFVAATGWRPPVSTLEAIHRTVTPSASER